MDKVVVDTNIFINAIFGRGLFKSDEKIMSFEEDGLVKFVFSRLTLNELFKVISTKVSQYNIFECSEIFEALETIRRRSKFVESPEKLPRVSSDKGDQPFLELAVSAETDYLITNDKQNGLLKLGRYNKVEIVTPVQYLKLYSKIQRHK